MELAKHGGAEDYERPADLLLARHEELVQELRDEAQAQQAARAELRDKALAPLYEALSRLKNVDSEWLASVGLSPDAVRAIGALAGDGERTGDDAADGERLDGDQQWSIADLLSLLGARASGAAVSISLALSKVLSGYRRWRQPGRGDTTGTFPVGTKELGQAESEAAKVRERSKQIRAVLAQVAAAIVVQLPIVIDLVKKNSDFGTYTPKQRQIFALLVKLTLAVHKLQRIPLFDEYGNPSEELAAVTDEIMKLLAAMMRSP